MNEIIKQFDWCKMYTAKNGMEISVTRFNRSKNDFRINVKFVRNLESHQQNGEQEIGVKSYPEILTAYYSIDEDMLEVFSQNPKENGIGKLIEEDEATMFLLNLIKNAGNDSGGLAELLDSLMSDDSVEDFKDKISDLEADAFKEMIKRDLEKRSN